MFSSDRRGSAEGSDMVRVLGYVAGGLDKMLDSAAVTGDVLACVEAGGAGAVRSGAVGRCWLAGW